MKSLQVQKALMLAESHVRKGELVQAERLYRSILNSFPGNVRAQQGLSRLHGVHRGALADKEPPAARVEKLIAIYHSKDFQAVIDKANALIADYPRSPIVWNILAAAQKATGNLMLAEKGFRKVISLSPSSAEAHYNLGMTLKEQGNFPAAIEAYQAAIKINPSYAEAFNNLANVFQQTGDLPGAIKNYRRALELVPSFHDALHNLGVTLKDIGALDEAIRILSAAARSAPTNLSANTYCSLGHALLQSGKVSDAMLAYQHALGANPRFLNAHFNIGNALVALGKVDLAITAYERAFEIDPSYAEAEAQVLSQRQSICDFSITERLSDASSRLGIETNAVPAFSALAWEDNPRQQLLRAMKWSQEQFKRSPLPLFARAKENSARLRVGYFSADFHDHATMFLMAGVLRDHDRKGVEVYAYSYGRVKTGEWRKRADSAVEHFFDVADYSDVQLADLARSHNLDIAIDLKGSTQHTRSQIFQYRLAPLQLNYLGFPGTMGADFYDYIVADPVVIPSAQREFYSEKVLYLPHTYFPSDNQRPIAHTETTRSDFELPEDAFVFCCFNNNYKITRREFDIWMRVLQKVQGSVLWLLRSNKWAEENLRAEATKRGVDPARLVFAEKLPPSEHLARHKHADLFLDTFNYNAHTTASDALWGGLPIVTKQGKQFAARVGASLLTAVGLPELIANTEEEYEDLICALATNPVKMAAIKAKLAQNRLTEPLFNTELYTRDFERGLKLAHERFVAGLPPEDIFISPSGS